MMQSRPGPSPGNGIALLAVRPWFALRIASVLVAAACGNSKREGIVPARASGVDAGAAASLPAEPTRVVLDIASLPTNCVRVATWPILDFRGSTRELARVDGAPVEPRDVVELQPTDSLRVRGQELRTSWHFLPDDLLPPAPDPKTLDIRLVKGVAKSVSVIVNGRALGRVLFGKGAASVSSLSLPTGALVPGRNEVVLRASGKLRRGEIAFGVDELRVREGASPLRTTEGGAASHAVAGQAVHGLSLRAGSRVRCYAAFPESATLRSTVGMQGVGEASLEIWSTSDRASPELLRRFDVAREGTASREIQLPLTKSAVGNAPQAWELRAVSSAPQVRVVLGNTRVTAPDAMAKVAEKPSNQHAKSAVLIVWGSLSKAGLGLYGNPKQATPALDALSARGTVFEHMRASSTYSQGAMGSMLTGRSPLIHRATDSRSVMSDELTTLGEAAREAGIRTGYFSANPTTTRLLGFGRGWDVVEEVLPGGAIPATRVFERAINFVQQHSGERWLVVIHARGGHPPWDADALELAALPPREYSGAIDPRSAGEWLEQVRRGRRPNRYTDADRARVGGLTELSLVHHDAYVARLSEAVQATGASAQTAWLIAGDVPPNETLPLPFGEGEFPDEPQLEVPLVLKSVRTPQLLGQRSTVPASSEDVASTVLGELGLRPPTSFGGIDLGLPSSTQQLTAPRVRVAMADGASALRLGDRVLQARGATPGRLCDLSLEPSCITDVRATYPVSAATLEFAFAPWLSRALTSPTHPVTIDATEAAARTVWGLP